MNIWDKTKPLPSEYINTFYDYLRNLKELFLDRFGLDHYMNGELNTALPTADGYHKHLTMPDFEQDDGYGNTIYFPYLTEDSQQLFVKKIDGLHELCFQNEDGIYQYTKDGRKALGNFWKLGYRDYTPEESNYSIAYGNGIYIAAGLSSSICRSVDGKLWEKVSVGITQIYVVAFVNNIFIVSGYNGNSAYSSDGLSWTLFNSTHTQEPRSIIYADNKYIIFATSSSSIRYSSDLTNWSSLSGVSARFRCIYHNGLFIGGGLSGSISTSIDGLSWIQRRYVSDGDSIYGITYYNGKYFAVGPSNVMSYSTDAISWTDYDHGIKINDNTFPGIFLDIINVNGAMILYGKSYDTGYIYVYFSKDGFKWYIIYSYYIGSISGDKFQAILGYDKIVACSGKKLFYTDYIIG